MNNWVTKVESSHNQLVKDNVQDWQLNKVRLWVHLIIIFDLQRDQATIVTMFRQK